MIKLQKNDLIRIVSPSGVIDPEYIDKASEIITSWGYRVETGQFAKESYGRFAGNPDQRLSDLQSAFDDPEVKAVLCSRGGYGLTQIVDKINFDGLKSQPKWLIGFSDVTVLHNALNRIHLPSIHGIMTKHISELSSGDQSVDALRKILEGELPVYNIDSQPENRKGTARGELVGGNLSVLMGLRGSPFDLDYSGKILFIEDIGENPYHIDRMMQNLRFSGTLSQLSGLVVGHFTDCPEDPLMMQSLREIILENVGETAYPVCFGFPSGHEDVNLPLVLGAQVELTVGVDHSALCFLQA